MSKNPHTGQQQRTKPPSEEYRDNYDKIFGKKEPKEVPEQKPNV